MKKLFNLSILIITTSAIEKSLTGRDCKKCILLNKNLCWQYDGKSNWGQSYCCGSSDSQCNSLNYCSKKVSSSSLKHFGCPVDKDNCPSASESKIVIRGVGKLKSIQKTEEWSRYTYRKEAFCKY